MCVLPISHAKTTPSATGYLQHRYSSNFQQVYTFPPSTSTIPPINTTHTSNIPNHAQHLPPLKHPIKPQNQDRRSPNTSSRLVLSAHVPTPQYPHNAGSRRNSEARIFPPPLLALLIPTTPSISSVRGTPFQCLCLRAYLVMHLSTICKVLATQMPHLASSFHV